MKFFFHFKKQKHEVEILVKNFFQVILCSILLIKKVIYKGFKSVMKQIYFYFLLSQNDCTFVKY